MTTIHKPRTAVRRVAVAGHPVGARGGEQGAGQPRPWSSPAGGVDLVVGAAPGPPADGDGNEERRPVASARGGPTPRAVRVRRHVRAVRDSCTAAAAARACSAAAPQHLRGFLDELEGTDAAVGRVRRPGAVAWTSTALGVYAFSMDDARVGRLATAYRGTCAPTHFRRVRFHFGRQISRGTAPREVRVSSEERGRRGDPACVPTSSSPSRPTARWDSRRRDA